MLEEPAMVVGAFWKRNDLVNRASVKFLLIIAAIVATAVSLLSGIAINLAGAAGTGWFIATVAIIGVVIFVVGGVASHKVWLYAYGAVAIMTALVWLVTHMHISVG
jgi:hypothetical protein